MNAPLTPDDLVFGANKIRETLAEVAPEPDARIGHFIILAERVDESGDWDTLYCCGPCQASAARMLRAAAAEIDARAHRAAN